MNVGKSLRRVREPGRRSRPEAVAIRRGRLRVRSIVSVMKRKTSQKLAAKRYFMCAPLSNTAGMVADSATKPVHGFACAAVSAFCIACNSFNTPRSLVDSSAFAPSDLASFGILVHFHEDSIHARCHCGARQHGNELGLSSAHGVISIGGRGGSCTECVASKTTGTNLRMMASERMSTTRLL